MKGYRSILVNSLTAVAMILALPEVSGLIPPEYIKYGIALQGVIAVVMRIVTTTPVGDKSQ